jgi:hypothetical protein
MRSISTFLAALSVPIGLLNIFGGIIAAIWLICLGIWKPIGVSFGLLFVGAWILSIALMPNLIFAIPAAKAAEKGHVGTAVFIGFFSMLYTAAVMVVWSFNIMKTYSHMGPVSAQWPLLLLSYGAATGPWAYMASKESQGPHGNPHSAIWMLFLSVGYAIAAGARLFSHAPFHTCLLILGICMIIGLIFQCLVVFEEHRVRSQFEL